MNEKNGRERNDFYLRIISYLSVLFLIISLSALTIFFDQKITTRIHEQGHNLAASLIGVNVTNITSEWTEVASITSEQEIFIGFFGGATAALVLCCAVALIVKLNPKNEQYYLLRSILSLILIPLMLSDVFVQVFAAFSEGFLISVYELLIGNEWKLFMLTLLTSSIALYLSSKINRLTVRHFVYNLTSRAINEKNPVKD